MSRSRLAEPILCSSADYRYGCPVQNASLGISILLCGVVEGAVRDGKVVPEADSTIVSGQIELLVKFSSTGFE